MDQSYSSLFPNLSDGARLWIFVLKGAPADLKKLLTHTRSFLTEWTSHGRSIQSQAVLVADQFLFVCGEIANGTISGCGIDALMNALEESSVALNCHQLSPMLMYFRSKNGTVASASRSQFREMLNQGLIHPDTKIFNLGIHTLHALRTGEFERPFSESVFAKIFRSPTTTS